MTYSVHEVHDWHRRQRMPYRHDDRRWAKTTTFHSGPYTDLEAARKVRSMLNCGKKQQRFWVLDEKGRVVPNFLIEIAVAERAEGTEGTEV